MPTETPTTDFKDSNGNNIYVNSALRGRKIWLAPGEYLILTNDEPVLLAQ
jgi:hypothetical protein